MQKVVTLLYKAIRKVILLVRNGMDKLIAWIILYGNNVKFGKFETNGFPYVSVAQGGSCIIGDDFQMNNGNIGNPIGRPQRCIFFVDRGAKLVIGESVGMSSTAIIAHQRIEIGDYVKIGGGVCIYDTDFHSLDAESRRKPESDIKLKRNKPVRIGDNVFIGAHSTILKGVEIGENSIIGACSVVTKSIPANEIWAGNPTQFLKKI
jgi:acetyltransferase-like isoleucine patch superfamily enzyme